MYATNRVSQHPNQNGEVQRANPLIPKTLDEVHLGSPTVQASSPSLRGMEYGGTVHHTIAANLRSTGQTIGSPRFSLWTRSQRKRRNARRRQPFHECLVKCIINSPAVTAVKFRWDQFVLLWMIVVKVPVDTGGEEATFPSQD